MPNERIDGTDGPDTLLGDEFKNKIYGYKGDDTLLGNGGLDKLYGGKHDDFLDGGDDGERDRLDGGQGDDTYRVYEERNSSSARVVDLVVELRNRGNDTVIASAMDYALGDNVENLTLIGGSNSGFGNDLDNVIKPDDADRNNSRYQYVLQGDRGNDTLLGGAGNDILDGGLDAERNESNYQTFGEDTMSGRDGDDIYYIDSDGDTIIESPNEGQDEARVFIDDYTLAANVENLTLTGTAARGNGNELDNTIRGNTVSINDTGLFKTNILNGYGGNDTLMGSAGGDGLNGGSGVDTMYGYGGDDTYLVDNAADQVIESEGGGDYDIVVSSLYSYRLPSNVEYLTLSGTSDARVGAGNELGNYIQGNRGDNRLYGADGNDALDGRGGFDLLSGGEGNDDLHGSIGRDDMYGGVGNDTYFINGSDDFAIENSNEGTDRAFARIDYELPDHVENLYLSFGARRGYGNNLRNNIFGNSRHDSYLDGHGGDDYLYGLERNDRLEGGRGNDVLHGGGGNDVLDGEALNNANEVDRLTGGWGADAFVLNDDGDIYEGLTIIYDFDVFEGDTVVLPDSGSRAMRYLDFEDGVFESRAGAYLGWNTASRMGEQIAFFEYNPAGGIGSETAIENLFRGSNSPIV